jgi:Flp pilus assembly protein TadG
MKRRLSSFVSDQRGSGITEFAFVIPVFTLVIMGVFDLAYRGYVHSVLQGEVQKAGRDSALEGGNSTSAGTSIDNRVKARVNVLVGSPTWTITRTRFQSFSTAGQAERFTDSNGNGTRNAGECFDDTNGNGAWDSSASSGNNGQGSADDIVLYKAQVSYPKVFPMYGLLGWSSTETVSATTVLRNQPYGSGSTYTTTTICT